MTRNTKIQNMGRMILLCIVLAYPAFAQQPEPKVCEAGAETVAYTGGYWFTGSGFAPRDVYVVNGLLSFKKPKKIDRRVDLTGTFVVPPYGEAHNHNVDFTNPTRTAALLAKYVNEGVFYAQNPANLPRSRKKLEDLGLVNVRGALQAKFSNGVLTANGGHPVGLYKRNLGLGILGAEDGEGAFFWTIDTATDLQKKWPDILAAKPDFIKTILLASEEYQLRKNDEKYFSWRGLDPSLLPDIVKRAHQASLRVMSHVETAMDFHAAIAAQVDIVGHIPGFRGNESGELPDPQRFEIREEDAKLAAKQRTIIVTTLAGIEDQYPLEGAQGELRKKFDALFRRNLTVLKKSGARLVIGSDNYRKTSREEALYIANLGVFTPLEMLRMWSEETPRSIFPGRNIGKLQEGYEASFLVLEKIPLPDFRNTSLIRTRVLQGCMLQ